MKEVNASNKLKRLEELEEENAILKSKIDRATLIFYGMSFIILLLVGLILMS